MPAIDLCPCSSTIEVNLSIKERRERPFVYPFAKEASSETAMQSKPPISNYADQYIHKTVVHPERVFCRPKTDVTHRSIANQLTNIVTDLNTPLSTSQSAYKVLSIRLSTTRAVKHPWTKRVAATGILPAHSVVDRCGRPSDLAILLPSCKKEDVNYMTSEAWRTNPRKRRFPMITAHNWSYNRGGDSISTTTRSTFNEKPLPIRCRIQRRKILHNIINGETVKHTKGVPVS